MEENIKVKKLKFFFLNILLITTLNSCKGQTNSNSLKNEEPILKSCYYTQELIDLIINNEMEMIEDDKLIKTKVLGGQGLPYVYDVSNEIDKSKGLVPANVLFWAKKDGKETLNFAKDNFSSKEKAVYDIVYLISKEKLLGHSYDIDMSLGLISYDGILGVNIDLSNFSYIEDRQIKGPKGIYPTYENGFNPVIIYQESSITVLYCYKNRWFVYVQRDI